MKKLLLPIAFFFFSQNIFAQIGGQTVYNFTTLPHTARVAALGGNAITTKDDDVALAYHNPATLNSEMNNQLTFSNSFYMTGINHGYFGYGRHIEKLKTTFHGGVQYIDYGDFQGTTATGQLTNSFSASEYAFTLGAGRRFNERLSFGANIKMMSSQFEVYRSLGIAADAGVFFEDTARRITATLLFKNMGSQITTFQPDNFEKIPFDIQIGISKQLRYLPFRFSIIVHNLHRWNITYDDPNVDEPVLLFGEDDEEPPSDNFFIDNLARHFIFNGEFLMGKRQNFRLRIGYNHLRRAELSVPNTVGFAGFNFGVGLKISKFRIDYGRSLYHLAGGANSLTVSTNLSEFRK